MDYVIEPHFEVEFEVHTKDRGLWYDFSYEATIRSTHTIRNQQGHIVAQPQIVGRGRVQDVRSHRALELAMGDVLSQLSTAMHTLFGAALAERPATITAPPINIQIQNNSCSTNHHNLNTGRIAGNAQNVTATAQAEKSDIEKRLEQLKNLLDKNLINNTEYENRRRTILDHL